MQIDILEKFLFLSCKQITSFNFCMYKQADVSMSLYVNFLRSLELERKEVK